MIGSAYSDSDKHTHIVVVYIIMGAIFLAQLLMRPSFMFMLTTTTNGVYVVRVVECVYFPEKGELSWFPITSFMLNSAWSQFDEFVRSQKVLTFGNTHRVSELTQTS